MSHKQNNNIKTKTTQVEQPEKMGIPAGIRISHWWGVLSVLVLQLVLFVHC